MAQTLKTPRVKKDSNRQFPPPLLQAEVAKSNEKIREAARKLGIEAAGTVVKKFRATHPAAQGPIDVVDLFSGCGGLSVGFEYLGRLKPSYQLVGAIDVDPHCVLSYRHNLPGPAIQGDLGEIAASPRKLFQVRDRLALRSTSPLILIGGPPCQGFSAHRKKNSTHEDQRNRLVEAFAEFVRELQPDFVVFENVPEVLAKKSWHYFKAVKETLNSEGYLVRAQIHNLAGFGVPQERFRAIIMAAKRPFEMPAPFLPSNQFRDVRKTIGALPPVLPGEQCESDPMHYCTRHRTNTIRTIRLVPKDGGRRPAGVGPPCLDRVDGFRDVYGRLYWDRPANTITGYARNPASGRYAHPEQDRGLTIREAALLQGFPERFTFEGPFTKVKCRAKSVATFTR